jgi:putative ABC transport system permease protein
MDSLIHFLMFLKILAIVAAVVVVAILPFFLLLLVCEYGLMFFLFVYNSAIAPLISGWPRFLVRTIDLVQNLKFVLIMLKSMVRNLGLTSLTYVANFVLVFIIIVAQSIVSFIDLVQTEREQDFKAIVTERNQVPSQMPMPYEKEIFAALDKEHLLANGEDDVMTWQFYGGTTDPEKLTRESIIFFFVMEPRKFLSKRNGKPISMMDGIEEFTQDQVESVLQAIQTMEQNKQGVLVGEERYRLMVKKDRLTGEDRRQAIGYKFKVTSLNYKEIDLECEIIGLLPKGRFDQSAVMHRDYLMQALDDYQRRNGKPHDQADKCLNLVWLRFPNKQAFERASVVLNDSSRFTSPPIKMETAASGISTFLEAYRDLIKALRYGSLFVVLIITLIFAVVIVIIVNGRRTEFAIMKVLGFQPWVIMFWIVGEAMLVGVISGFICSVLSIILVNKVMGGIPFPIAFFPAFKIPSAAYWWGPAAGAFASFVGAIFPALSARRVKAVEVFSKVA